MSKSFKILYTSDLHGRENLYRQLLEKIRSESVQSVILGGDLLPRKAPGLNSLDVQKAFVKNQLQTIFQEIRQMNNCSIYLILGNDDWAATLPLFGFMVDDKIIHLLHGVTRILDSDYIITGYPFVPPTPFRSKDFEKLDKKTDTLPDPDTTASISVHNSIQNVNVAIYYQSRTSIEQDLGMIHKEKEKHTIFVMHSPPFNTKLDLLHGGQHIGSEAIREFIMQNQPDITLHGHIHESPAVSGYYWDCLGETLSINPGQTGDELSAVLFDLYKPKETLTHTQFGKAFH